MAVGLLQRVAAQARPRLVHVDNGEAALGRRLGQHPRLVAWFEGFVHGQDWPVGLDRRVGGRASDDREVAVRNGLVVDQLGRRLLGERGGAPVLNGPGVVLLCKNLLARRVISRSPPRRHAATSLNLFRFGRPRHYPPPRHAPLRPALLTDSGDAQLMNVLTGSSLWLASSGIVELTQSLPGVAYERLSGGGGRRGG